MSPSSNRILIIDDHEGSRLLLRTLLKNGGYRVLEAVDGVDGLEKVQKEKTRFGDPRCGDAQTPTVFEVAGAPPSRGQPDSDLDADQFQRRVLGGSKGWWRVLTIICQKPFDHAELARPGARSASPLVGSNRRPPRVLKFGDLTVDLAARTAELAGEPVSITKTEYGLLDLLGRHLEQPVSRENHAPIGVGVTPIFRILGRWIRRFGGCAKSCATRNKRGGFGISPARATRCFCSGR